MNPLVCFAFAMLLALLCKGKPVQFQGYPEENRNINIPFSADLFEGDMLVGSKIKKIALAGGDVSMAATGSRKRGATKFDIWPNAVIPFAIDSSVNDAKNASIIKAMREWENGTCLSFVPFVNDGKTNAYLKIQNSLPGCFSVVGYKDVSHFPPAWLPFGILLNLGPLCNGRRVILHELGHAIGFYHEQSRPDRDDYVKILHSNIMAGKESEFKKYPNTVIDSLDSPYDLTSIMHYGPKQFSENGKITIDSINANETLVVNYKISDIDKEQVNKLYNCP